jgi:hypothetical protein
MPHTGAGKHQCTKTAHGPKVALLAASPWLAGAGIEETYATDQNHYLPKHP